MTNAGHQSGTANPLTGENTSTGPKPRRWRNWGRTVTAHPARTAAVGSADAIVATIAEARRVGLTIRPVGAGHSFTAIAATEGIQVTTEGLGGLIAFDRQARQVTVGGGTRLHRLPGLLAPLGLAMQNLGDIDTQSIAGAISTSTHGTGLGFAGIAGQVAGLALVDGRGELVRFTGEDARAAAVSLGALGIITEVTLQCVDAFGLHCDEHPEPLAEVLDSFEDRVSGVDHFEFFWFPHTDVALTKTLRRLDGDATLDPLTAPQRWAEDELSTNVLFGAVQRAGGLLPSAVPALNRLCSRLATVRQFSDRSTSVFATPRRVRFAEMEYSLPLENLPEGMRAIDSLIRRRGWRISFPVECRTAAADDVWLSTGTGRPSGYIAVHRFAGQDPTDYFAGVEEIMQRLGGRPHWGKLHTMTAPQLRERYPRFDDFLTLRDRHDPDRIFSNPYLDRVLGD